MLGCGSVGSQVVRLLARAGRRPRGPRGRAGRAGRRRRAPPRRAARGRGARRAAHHRRRRPGGPRRRRPRRRGDRRHRARPLADPVRARERRLAWSPPTRRCSPRTARRSSRRPRRPGATSTTRPRSPAPSRSCARCASRSPATEVTRVLGIVNGTTNFILDKMDTSGAGFAEALEEAQELGYAEADPTADVEGFDAAAKAAILASLAFHSRVTAADVHREGISEVTAADVAVGPRHGQRRQAARDLRAEPGADGDEAVAVRVHPAMIPRVAPAGVGARGLQRGLRRVRGRRPADVLRPRRRRRADRVGGARRPGHRRPQPARRHPRRRRVGVRRPGGAADGGDPSPATTWRSTSTTARACWPRSRPRSPSTASRSRPCARRAAAPTPSSSSSRTRPPTRS